MTCNNSGGSMAAGAARRLARIRELERDITQIQTLAWDYDQARCDLPEDPRYDLLAVRYAHRSNAARARAADLERRRDALLVGED